MRLIIKLISDHVTKPKVYKIQMSDSTRKPNVSSHPDISTLRTDYSDNTLDTASAPEDPITLFKTFWDSAVQYPVHTPNACTLTTATPSGKPSARIVLLRDFSAEGFTFYTNYNSRKGQELDANPTASLLFFWAELEVQVRIEGVVERVSSKVSDAYFATRPKESQLGAWASPQSDVLQSREALDNKMQATTKKMEEQLSPGDPIPRPPFWGGYRLTPNEIEFWKGRPNRLHDRIVYQTNLNKQGWTLSRLAP